jgi:hypothetical protein
MLLADLGEVADRLSAVAILVPAFGESAGDDLATSWH